jgi:hypothetical protein
MAGRADRCARRLRCIESRSASQPPQRRWQDPRAARAAPRARRRPAKWLEWQIRPPRPGPPRGRGMLFDPSRLSLFGAGCVSAKQIATQKIFCSSETEKKVSLAKKLPADGTITIRSGSSQASGRRSSWRCPSHRHRCTDPGKNSGQHATTGAVAAIDDPQGVAVRVIFGSLPSRAVDPAVLPPR